MLACMLGKSGEIFFPKLENEQMVYFKEITEHFFNDLGIGTKILDSEEIAKQEISSYKSGNPYPVFYFNSDTSGEKLYEEFYTEYDEIDLNTFNSLGIVKNAKRPKLNDIKDTLLDLKKLLNSQNYEKSDIVNLLKKYIPDFKHIETGKSLDQKM